MFVNDRSTLKSLATSPRFCSYLICTADKKRRAVTQLAEPAVDVGAQNATDNVSEMRHVVHIRQRRCDEDIPLALDGKDLFLLRHVERTFSKWWLAMKKRSLSEV